MTKKLSAEGKGIFLRAVHADYSAALREGKVTDFQDDMDQLGNQPLSFCTSMCAAKPLENNALWQAFL